MYVVIDIELNKMVCVFSEGTYTLADVQHMAFKLRVPYFLCSKNLAGNHYTAIYHRCLPPKALHSCWSVYAFPELFHVP